jgi:hypothetical protein
VLQWDEREPYLSTFNHKFEGEKEMSKKEEVVMTWTKEAEERLQKVPVFVRPMAKKGIEKMARKQGITIIDAEMMDKAKSKLMG